MELAIGLIGGFLLGILASAIAWLITERASGPCLDIVVDQNRAQGQSSGNPPHEFYHVRVRNISAKWPLPGRRPAWACTASVEVFQRDGSRTITGDVIARWTSQPEPLLPVVTQGQVGNVLDPARVMQARRVDVHGHSEEPISVAVKFEGEQDCYIFTNESYLFPRWQNPSWRIPPGRYRLRVTIYYERGRAEKEFELRNEGISRDDVHMSPWPNR
jgi:hypothetical protein